MNENTDSTGNADTTATASATAIPIPAVGSEERNWALFGHLSAFSAFITGFGCILGPLIIWLVKRDTMPFAADQAKEALNFNITLLIVGIGLGIFSVVTLGIGLIVALPAFLVLFIGWIILTIVGAVNANNGVLYRYPLTLRLIQ